MSRYLRFIIMGPPGSGKGTISNRIVRDFKLEYISSGDVLRSHVHNKTSFGKAAETYIEKGKLVPDELISDLICDKLQSLSKNNWLLDGFPRTLNQAEVLSKSYDITLAINLIVPDEVIISRLKGRWVHGPSGRIYNLEFNPPKITGQDDVTGEALIQRNDDKPDIVLTRLQNYRNYNAPVLEYYRKKNILKEFAGKQSDEIWPKVKLCLNEVLRRTA